MFWPSEVKRTHARSLIIIVWWLFLAISAVQADDKARRLKCADLKKARRDRLNCTSSGAIECHPGWSGTLCNRAECREGCHSTHGYCTQPGECKCAPGWRGKNCAECVPLPGCKHGSCLSRSYECICDSGWEGDYCSRPVCRKGCHSSRGYCKFPDECRCRIGWGGDTCELCKSLPGCENGFCTKPHECRCLKGWTGVLCDKPICRDNCSVDHGFCLEPGECRCEVGWWGPDCFTCFPYPGCKHGTCTKPWTCICKPGWKGILCDQRNITRGSYCDQRPNMCQNGGTCLNFHAPRQKYTCSCPTLFTGRHCEYLAYSRTPIFPIWNRKSEASRSKQKRFKSTTPNTTVSSTTSSTTISPTTSTIKTTSESTTTPNNTESTTLPSKDEPMKLSPIAYSVSTSVSMLTSPSGVTPSSNKEGSVGKLFGSLKKSVANMWTKEIKNSDDDLVDRRRKKYFESKLQKKKSDNFEGKDKFEPDERSNNIGKSQSSVLVLELNKPSFKNDFLTDAHNLQANQIPSKHRFLRHQDSVINFPSQNVAESSPPSFFQFQKLLVEKPRRPNLRINRYILPPRFDSIAEGSSPTIHKLRNAYRSPRMRVNRRTGFPPSSSLYSPVTVYTPRQSSNQRIPNKLKSTAPTKLKTTRKRPNKVAVSPLSYYEEHYDGRVHIGDVTEVDKNAPWQEILDAFIELKKL